MDLVYKNNQNGRTEAPGMNPVARLMEACVCQGNGGQWGDKLFWATVYAYSYIADLLLEAPVFAVYSLYGPPIPVFRDDT